MSRKQQESGLLTVPTQSRNGLTAIAASMLRATDNSHRKTVMVTSCRSGEGKTTTAINVAKALVEEAGRTVLLVDGNHENPSLHHYFNVDNDLGFNDIVHGRAASDQVLSRQRREQLTVIPYGPKGPRNLDFYRADRFLKINQELSTNFDVLIMDGPSIFGKQDPGGIASAFDGSVLVIECEKTPWEVVQSGTQRLEEIGAHMLGAVMNKRKYYIPRGLYA